MLYVKGTLKNKIITIKVAPKNRIKMEVASEINQMKPFFTNLEA